MRTANYRGGQRSVELLGRCRELRSNATDAERALWRRLRDRQIAGAKFRRQHQFGPYVLDFFCPEHRLAVEVDGGQHYDEDKRHEDQERTLYLQTRGIRVLRFTNLEVLKKPQAVLERLWGELDSPVALTLTLSQRERE